MSDDMTYWKKAAILMLILMVIGFVGAAILSAFVDEEDLVPAHSSGGNVAIIEISGLIVSESPSGFFAEDVASADSITRLIRKAGKRSDIDAVVFKINSPGGSAVASDEIAREIKKLNKTTVSMIREVGASGGYWIASATDHIIANPMSITGSIGVIASYLEFSGFMDRYNVTYQRMVAGDLKDLGSPFKDLTAQERRKFQRSLDRIHEFFIEEVATNRDMPIDDVRLLATGEFFVGAEAFENGLVDELGSRDELIAYLKAELGDDVSFTKFESEGGFFGSLGGLFDDASFQVGRGIGYEFSTQSQRDPELIIRT